MIANGNRAAVRVAVVFGGSGSEADVSRAGARRVIESLQARAYDVTGIECTDAIFEQLRDGHFNVVFNAMHGTWGEDGRIQAIFEWLRLPYTGSDVTACALAFDKHLTKQIYRAENIPTPRWILAPTDAPERAEVFADSCAHGIVLKPRREGSSSGVRLIAHRAEIAAALLDACNAGLAEVIVEERIAGRECTVGVWQGAALPVVEIIAAAGHDFYSYDAKYAPGGSRHIVPAEIGAEQTASLQDLALRAHGALGLRDYSRTDILIDQAGRPLVLETNTLPGLTATSLLPDAAAAAGIAYDDVIEGILRMALERAAVPAGA